MEWNEFVQAGMDKLKERFGSFFQLEGGPKFRKTFEPVREADVYQLPDYVEIEISPVPDAGTGNRSDVKDTWA